MTQPPNPALPENSGPPEHPGVTDDALPAPQFEEDALTLLVAAVHAAVRLENPRTGTEHLVSELVMGDTAAGEAVTPGMRKAGELGGTVKGIALAGEDRHWVSRDAGPGPLETHPDDETEAEATWREIAWRAVGEAGRGLSLDEDTPPPGPTGALLACLRHALGLARAERTESVRCRHLARALVELPGSRAREAMTLSQVDLDAARTALDALDAREADAAGGPDFPVPRAVAGLRNSGTLEGGKGRIARAVYSWMFRMGPDNNAVLLMVRAEAVRHAVRRGQAAVEPADLLLAILSLDRAMTVVGQSFPEDIAGVNSAAELLRAHGAGPAALHRATAGTDTAPVPGVPATDFPLSPAADRVMARTRLLAAERSAATTGTLHVLAALLDASDAAEAGAATDPEAGPAAGEAAPDRVADLLRTVGVDIEALRAASAPDTAA
ncbi:Clp protease N-terminal domain-containing protein [Streptomyces sp. NPDC093085]|uniref:Clp protease N-terminal domain-containing protein n=1 Tax=Streptomyces sp. NPDC093085 TaxID=3155068 RepID=UPI003438EDCA